MRKKRIKFLSCYLIVFLILMMFGSKANAASITASITGKQIKASTVDKAFSYSRPSTLKGKKPGMYYLTSTDGVFCLDHNKWLWKDIAIGTGDYEEDVTKKSNEMNYIFGCQIPKKVKDTREYNKSLIQNYLWKYDVFGYNSLKKAPTNSYEFEKIKQANTDYEEYENNILNKEGSVRPEVTNENKTQVKFSSTSTSVTIKEFQMNNYTYLYSDACSYVNKTVNYNSYGGTQPKIANRAGVVAGIVDAELEITDAGGNVTTLTHSKNEFSFTYKEKTEVRKKKGNYLTYPLPNETFYVKMPAEAIDLNDSFTVRLKFKYIRIKANDIKKATIYVTRTKDIKDYQPLLCVGAGMGTREWVSVVKIQNKVSSVVSIKVFGIAVEGGTAAESENYKYGGKDNKDMLPYKDAEGNMLLKSRGSMNKTFKKENPFLAEVGDKLTFVVKIKNEGKTTATLKNIKWSGCEYFETAEFSRKMGSEKTETITVGADKLLENEEGIKLEPGTILNYYVVAKDTTNSNAKSKHLRVDIGTCENATLTNKYDVDFFTFKWYNVTLDKYIDKVNDQSVKMSADKNTNSATGGTKDDEENDAGDDDDNKDDDDEGYDFEDDRNESDVSGDLEMGKIYIQRSSSTEKILIGPNKEISATVMTEAGGSATVCYLDTSTGKYYYTEMSEPYCSDITNYIKNDGRDYFDIAGYSANGIDSR